MLTCRRGSNMAEAAITMPVVLLVLLFTINLSMASYTAVSAASAANYAARVGAVSEFNPEDNARRAVQKALANTGAGGTFGYFIKADDTIGGGVLVVVAWKYPSYLSGLCRLFGVGGDRCPSYFSGYASSVWKKEGL
jgi:Flp pilus assembly protein TadG